MDGIERAIDALGPAGVSFGCSCVAAEEATYATFLADDANFGDSVWEGIRLYDAGGGPKGVWGYVVTFR